MIKNALYRKILSKELRDPALVFLRSLDEKSVADTVFLALALAARGDFVEGHQQLESINAKDVPKSLQGFYLEARLLCDSFQYKGKNLKRTQQLVEEVLKLEPQAAFARLIKAFSLADEKNYKQAEQLLKEIIDDYPEAEPWRVYLVQFQIRDRDFKSARISTKSLSPGYWRTTYWMWANLIFPMAYLWMVLVPVGILILQAFFPPEIFLLPAIAILLLLFQAKRMKDFFSYSRLIYMLAIICISMAISWYARA